MDEPLSNLDAPLRMQLRAELARLHAAVGTTTVFVTHDQLEAMSLGQRVAVVRDGRLEQVGTPLDLYDHPATAFVAGFIGSPPMNLLPAVLDIDGLRLPGGRVPGPFAGAVGDALVVGVRAEHLAIIDADPGDGVLAARCERVEELGTQRLVHAIVDGGPEPPVRILAAVPRSVPACVGDALRVGLRRADLHVFDAATGARRDGGS